MEFLMKVNGFKEKDKDKVPKFGQTVVNMWVNGKIIKQMDLEYYIMQMGIFMKGNGLMIKPVDKGHILMKTEQNMWVNGKMINKMDMVFNNG